MKSRKRVGEKSRGYVKKYRFIYVFCGSNLLIALIAVNNTHAPRLKRARCYNKKGRSRTKRTVDGFTQGNPNRGYTDIIPWCSPSRKHTGLQKGKIMFESKTAKQMLLLRYAEKLDHDGLQFLIDLAKRMQTGENITVEQAKKEWAERKGATNGL